MSRAPVVVPMTSLARPVSLSDRIYADLLGRLQQGAIPPSERLVDVDLARTYGTSRMPVRDALMRLTNEGYLVGTTRGFAVPQLSAKEVRDIFEVRRQIEPYAAGCAARDLDQAAQRQLSHALKSARAAHTADDQRGMITANIAFRDAWLSGVSNKRLAETILRFADQVHTVRITTLVDPATRRIVIQGLEGQFEAFTKRNAALAVKRMLAFIDAAESAYFAARSNASASDDAQIPSASRRRR
jgi:DNA-binding GntR family transcriptional regulator